MTLVFSATIRVRLVYMVALAVILTLPNIALAADNCGSLERMSVGLRLVRALYPELKGKELRLTLGEGNGGESGPAQARNLFVKVDKAYIWPKDHQQSDNIMPQHDDLQLPLSFHVDFVDLTSNGKVICRPVEFQRDTHSKQLGDAWAVIEAHPEWTDEEDVNAAKKQGMRFGPDNKAAVLRSIPWKELGLLYTPLRIKRVRFNVAGVKEPHSSFADLRWYIDADELGTPRELTITFDPFVGRVDGISEGKR